MNFDDTPQEAAFRAEARNWVDANAPKQYEAELSKASLGRIKLQKEEIVDVGKAWQKKKAEAGWACLHWPKEYGGRGATPDRAGDLAAGRRRLRQADAAVPDRRGHVRADRDGLWQRGAQTPLSAEARRRRTDLVPVVFRTRRRIRCRGPAHPRGEEGRQLDRQRPEDLDFGRALFRLWPADHAHRSQCAQAQGLDHVLPRHEEPRRRDQADQAGQRHAGIQRGVLSPTS